MSINEYRITEKESKRPTRAHPGRDIISVRVGALDLLLMELEEEEKSG